MNNAKKVTYNLIMGMLSEIVAIVLGIIIPRLTLSNYGSEVNGLISSVTQIYAYLALLEAGIGTATVQALYRTSGSDDRIGSNAILSATNRYYKKIGFVYLGAIIVFSVLYPLIIKTEVPTVTVILVIVFNGLGNVVNFLVQGKYFLLLQAEGRTYVQTSLNMFINVFRNVARIVLMAMGFDVILVQAMALVASLLQMLYIKYYIKKHYEWVNVKALPDYKSIAQSKNVLVHQIGGLVFNNTDTVLLTFFCGLKVVSVYSMYALLFGMINTALGTVTSSTVFTMGQVFHTDKERFHKLFNSYELLYMGLAFALYSIANFFVLPFLKLYTAGITDINYIDKALPLLFIATYLLSCGRTASVEAISFAGHFKQTQNQSIIEAGINLTVSVIAVQFYGIYGALMGTIAALLYRANASVLYAGKHVLQRSAWITYKRWLINLIVFCAILFANLFIQPSLCSYLQIFAWCIPYSICVLALYFGVNYITEPEVSKEIWNMLKRYVRRG